ncbi:uncharacterized protein LOC100124186 [Nasonia vitripennis]|uniref:FAM234A/B beta-propeller domain-containing protein n=1 Tax=Nasonia vitripennis TaxID=7425 RepID=A0A7M7G8S4_NASVI|nr:uncharacterized protein LOC100124186 [Nasonia vitripennis]
MSGEPNVKGYAPLPQSISNTDTEDDDEEHQHHREHADSLSKDDDQSRISDTTTICQNGRFYPLDETKNLANRARNGRNSFGYSTDNIPIMILDGQSHDDLWKRHDMSPLRRFCLVASVLLCILTILIFLYVLPCDNSSICPPAPEPKTSVSWDKTLEGVEINGRITVIPGSPYNLIFLLRGQQFGDIDSRESPGQQQITPEGGGVLSMQGTSGIPLWWVVLKRLPTDIDCEILDTDGSGKPDCLVSGEGGLLVSIEPIAGTIHWNSEIHAQPALPLLLSDLDSDGINDLLTIELTNSSQSLVFLSGKSGKVLARQSIPGCQSVELSDIDSAFVLSYTCHNGNSNQSTKTILLKNLIESINFSQARRKLALTVLTQPATSKPPASYPNQTSTDSWDLTPHHRLYVRNVAGDRCPSDVCQTSVNLTLVHARNESRIWDHASASSFVTRPAILDTFGQAYTAGFALKFWNWTADTAAEDKEKSVTPGPTTVRQQSLTERVSIIFVNNTEVHVMNASQSELIQLCRGQDCQPSLPRQAHSIRIADLNGDGVMELISYRTTYNMADDISKATLTSKVQIVKLDAVF